MIHWKKLIAPLLLLLSLLTIWTPGLLNPILKLIFPRAGEWIFPRASLFSLTIEHLILSVSAAGIAALAGVSLAVFATRKFGQPFMPMVRDAASLAQTIPPAAVLALAIPFLGFGSKPVLFALVLYSILPVLNNTLAALEGLSPSVLETAHGMGLSPFQVLLKIEIPLALPIIGTGVRISTVINVGTSTIGAIAGAGGLGSPIVAGLIRNNPAWVFQGAAASAVLALLLNHLLKLLENHLLPGGHTPNH